ncbi:stage II sporulation protein D [Lentibacillus cibarius]|uniref:Stage II sporulation protein D n=1 Tax=Lentibacillus cibarius TaxID=2583219 RepID=A0A549YFU6_9BACI|nr:stage II sporulation protein D [Lentibacillus cibarius]TRM10745.1 stage II sporulation protein D [Lentibacillus cibarius]
MKKKPIIPKTLKKKRPKSLAKRDKLQLLQKNKKPLWLSKASGRWKIPVLLFLTSLLMVILILPTAVVLPFMSSGGAEGKAVERSAAGVEVALGESPFSVEVARASTDEVEDVPLETYVSRVVASETPAEFDMEALKAQALAARTYIVNRLLHQDNSDKPDVTDTTSDQVYHNEEELRKTMGSDYNKEMKKIKKAVAATKGEILTYKDQPITPAYFSTSNGYTENSEDYWKNEVPYLRSVKSPWDKDTPKFLDQQIFTLREVEKQLKTDLPDIKNLTMEIARTDSNRVSQLNIGGKTYTGRDVREALGLRSTDFTIEKKNNHLIFTTKGYGHGIGMSQYGANGMAKEGKTYKEIVQHYYQGIDISTVNDAVPTLVAK